MQDFFLGRYENGAVETLRTIGSAQLSYQGMNNETCYGSLQALQDKDCFDKDCTLGTIIEGYEVEWQTWIASTTGGWGCHSKFTIIAKPNGRVLSNLRTFAILQDQVVRVYNPSDGNIESSLTSWEKVIE